MSEVEVSTEERALRARAAREALVGRSIAGRYVLRALIGQGGMGAVYEAEHTGLGKRVAIKFVDAEFATDEQVVIRFAREARAMSTIESAHIVTVFDAGTEDGRPYLVMELLRGEDLGQRLRRLGRVPLAEALHVVAQVLKGLSKAHAAGIVHRDLKPDNVFLVKSDTDPLFAKIVDFGVSKIERPREKTSPLALTGRGTVLGTPLYMCPEQAQAMTDVDARADIYSVGAILFECLSGRPPHTGETYEQVILSICMRDAPDLRAIDPNVPVEVASFVGRALSRDRVQRFASAERMLAALHELAPEEKRRVPLEVPAETLVSPGLAPAADAREAGVGNATRIAGSLGAEPASSAASRGTAARPSTSTANDMAPAPASEARHRRGRSRVTIAFVAALAMATGIGATMAVLFALRGPKASTDAGTSARRTAPARTLTVDAASEAARAGPGAGSASIGTEPEAPPASEAIASSSAPARSAEPEPAPSSRPPPTEASASPAQKASGGRGSGARPGAAKPLDIARELP